MKWSRFYRDLSVDLCSERVYRFNLVLTTGGYLLYLSICSSLSELTENSDAADAHPFGKRYLCENLIRTLDLEPEYFNRCWTKFHMHVLVVCTCSQIHRQNVGELVVSLKFTCRTRDADTAKLTF